MGRIGKIYPRNEVAAYKDWGRGPAGNGPTRSSVLSGTHAIVVTAMRHKLAGALIALLFLLGLAGWLVTYWPWA